MRDQPQRKIQNLSEMIFISVAVKVMEAGNSLDGTGKLSDHVVFIVRDQCDPCRIQK